MRLPYPSFRTDVDVSDAPAFVLVARHIAEDACRPDGIPTPSIVRTGERTHGVCERGSPLSVHRVRLLWCIRNLIADAVLNIHGRTDNGCVEIGCLHTQRHTLRQLAIKGGFRTSNPCIAHIVSVTESARRQANAKLNVRPIHLERGEVCSKVV